MGLAAMDFLIGSAEGTDLFLDASDQAEGDPLLLGPGVSADRAQLADPCQGTVEAGYRVNIHQFCSFIRPQ
jgi:hypothetical protein